MSAPSSSQSPSLPLASPPSIPPGSPPSFPPGSPPSFDQPSPPDATTPLASRVKRVRAIIREQFGSEVNYKESELEMIEERIHLARMMLQRLRLGVLAQHYGVAAFYPTALDYREETIGEQHNWEMFEELLIRQDLGDESASPEDATREGACGGGAVEGEPDEMVASDKAELGTTLGGAGVGEQEKLGTTVKHNHVLQAVPMETSPPPTRGTASLPVAPPLVAHKDPLLMDPPLVAHKGSPLFAPKDPPLVAHKGPPLFAPKDPPLVTHKGPPLFAPKDLPLVAHEGPPLFAPKDPPLMAHQGPLLFAPKDPPLVPRTDPTLLPGKDRREKDQACADGESRFYFKKRVIVGNTSQYLDPAAHHVKGDGSTHKWMVYVRGPPAEPSISHFVKAVRFFLHPSYHPNDIVHVCNPPFHLTRLGWGEFPVRVQLEFCDKFNKSVDIIHNLVLDRTHTGQQTLGAETVVDLDIVAPPPGSDKTFRMNDVSISSMTVKQGEGMSSNATVPPLPPLTDLPPLDRDGSTSPSTPTMWSGGTTPHSVGAGGSGVLTTNLDKCLHAAVRNIPIYGKSNPMEEFYIPAPSLAQFRLWHIGRRRATEWERAVAVRKSIERKLKLPSLLSTKQVMQWCRQNGYTPLDPVPPSGRGFCKVCGCQLDAGLDEDEEDWGDDGEDEGSEGVGVARKCPEVHEHCQIMMFGRHGLPLRGNTMDPFEELHPNSLTEEEGVTSLPKLCSLSQPHELVAKVFSHQGRLEDKAKKQEEDVDVCFMPASPSCARSRALVDMVPRFRVPQTPELKWVQQTAASVGIHIYPAVIDRMYAHVVEHMIYISCTRFLRGILAQAVQGAGQLLDGKLSQDRVLTPFHVQQAILKLEHCDFLTNQYTGVQLRTEEGGGGNMANESSSSSSSGGSSDEGEGP